MRARLLDDAPASMKNQARPLTMVTSAAKSRALLHPNLVAMKTVKLAMPRRPGSNVAIIPETEPELFVEISVHAV